MSFRATTRNEQQKQRIETASVRRIPRNDKDKRVLAFYPLSRYIDTFFEKLSGVGSSITDNP